MRQWHVLRGIYRAFSLLCWQYIMIHAPQAQGEAEGARQQGQQQGARHVDRQLMGVHRDFQTMKTASTVSCDMPCRASCSRDISVLWWL